MLFMNKPFVKHEISIVTISKYIFIICYSYIYNRLIDNILLWSQDFRVGQEKELDRISNTKVFILYILDYWFVLY